ncbi:MAG: hypothetical protein L7F78_17835 [Syntrophales bacterium LBB04]|nr:hypothetical protein [Syntrophales bacterium LBB04]
MIDTGAISQEIAVDKFVNGTLQGVCVRDAQQLANALLRVERDTSLIGYDSQKDIEQSFRVAQAFQEALAYKTMFDPSEAAVTTADAFGSQDGDIGSHEAKISVCGFACPSRFALLTQGWGSLTPVQRATWQ